MSDPQQRKSPRKRVTSAKAKAQTLASSPKDSAKQKTRKKLQAAPQPSNPQTAPPSAPKLSKPRQCRQCPGNPLRSQCAHTKAGRQYVMEQQLRQRISVPSAPAQLSTISVSRQQDAAAEVSVHGRSEPGQVQQALFQTMNPQVILSNPTTPAVIPDHQCQTSLFSPDPQVPSATSVYALNTVPRSNQDVFTPETPTRRPAHYSNILQFTPGMPVNGASPLETRSRQSPSPGDSTSSVQQVYDPALDDMSFTPQRHQSATPTTIRGSETPHSPSSHEPSRRPKATVSNPMYGSVNGVMRGSHPYNIIRHQALPAPIQETKKASKKFRDGFNGIIRKVVPIVNCEDLSAQTGCWLFVGGQHAAASGSAIHYASPRLCKDGGAHANALATQYLQVIKQIADSRRVDTMELQQNLQKSKQEGAKLKDRVSELEEQVRNAERDAQMLQEYRRRLGITSDDGS